MRQLKRFICFLFIALFFIFPKLSFAIDIKDVPLGSEHQGTVVNESVTKTETKVIKEEVKEVLEEKKTDPVISSNSPTVLEQIKSLWQKAVEVVVNTIDAVFPFLNPKRAEEAKPKSNQIIIDSLAGSITPAYNIYKLYINISTPKPKAKPQSATTSPVLPLVENNANIIEKIITSSTELANMLTNEHNNALLRESDPNNYEPVKNYNNKFSFSDPYDSRIPEKFKEVYTWADPKEFAEGTRKDFENCSSCNWDPRKYPENPIECTTFVYMVYNNAGTKLPLGLGNANEWADTKRVIVKDNFDVYTSGRDSTPIEEGEILVWDEGNSGHVGVVTEVGDDFIIVKNANSTQTSYNFKTEKIDGKITIKSRSSTNTWAPDHWMKLKSK